jgi:hypothetical protein
MIKPKPVIITIMITTVSLMLFGCGFLGLSPIEMAGTIAKNKTDSRIAYDNYVMEMQKNNTEREKNHLQPIVIESYKQWLKER